MFSSMSSFFIYFSSFVECRAKFVKIYRLNNVNEIDRLLSKFSEEREKNGFPKKLKKITNLLKTFLALRYNVLFQSRSIFKTRPHRFHFLQDEKTEERTLFHRSCPSRFAITTGSALVT